MHIWYDVGPVNSCAKQRNRKGLGLEDATNEETRVPKMAEVEGDAVGAVHRRRRVYLVRPNAKSRLYSYARCRIKARRQIIVVVNENIISAVTPVTSRFVTDP